MTQTDSKLRKFRKCSKDILERATRSRSEVFCRKGVSQKFRKIHRKTPVPKSLFNKVAGLRPVTSLKKEPWHRCFPVNFAKFLRAPFIIEHLWWLLLESIFRNLFFFVVIIWNIFSLSHESRAERVFMQLKRHITLVNVLAIIISIYIMEDFRFY